MKNKRRLGLGVLASLVWCFLGAQSAWAADFTVSPTSYDFGYVTNGSSATKEFTVTNTSGVSKSIALGVGTLYTSVNWSGGSNPCGSSAPVLANNQSCTLTYTFAPRSSGSFTNERDRFISSALTSYIYLSGTAVPPLTNIYRFWSPVYAGHFFTASADEKNEVIANYPGVWGYEGEAWQAYPDEYPGALPVYRFWSDVYGHHFYTISETEKDEIIDLYWEDDIWTYEEEAYYAFTTQVSGTVPVYRFWSPVFSGHFFTTSEIEKNDILTNKAKYWTYEGIAFYVK